MSPRLSAHCPEPFVAVHPADGKTTGLTQGGFAQVTTRYGACVLKVVFDPGLRKGSLFAPIHWSDATASGARICDLVSPFTDPFSGQPEAKATPAALTPVSFRFRGFAVTRQPCRLPCDGWWARVTLAGGSGLLFATNDEPSAWRARARELFGQPVELAEYADGTRQVFRMAAFYLGHLEGCLFVGPADATPNWEIIKAIFDLKTLSLRERRALLSGRSTQGFDFGPLVCTCFGIGLNAISNAVATQGAVDIEQIGRVLKAGTNCGSCLPELKRIVSEYAAVQPA